MAHHGHGRARVRTHRRRTASGRVTTVHRHVRKTTLAHRFMDALNRQHRAPRSNRRRVSFVRGVWTLYHAGRALRRGKVGRFVGLAILGSTETVGWLTLRTTGVVLATATLALGTSAAWMMSRTTPDRRPGPKDIRAQQAPKRQPNKAIK